ncbi:MAG: hypothetical protein CUN55_15335, partial [Phototrophicales bacterium]
MNILWFRNDLRLDDQPALAQAVHSSATIAIYLLNPTQWDRH